jgi:sugar phosphate isomerase/epimerase
MKIGLVLALNAMPPTAPLLFAGRLDEGLDAAARLGCDGVELNILDPAEVDGTVLLRALRQRGLGVCTLATGQAYGRHGLSLASREADVRRHALERLKTHVRLAARLGSGVTVGLMRGMLAGDAAERTEGLRWIADGLRELSVYAGLLGVPVYLEPLNRYECNNINTIAEAQEMILAVGAANVLVLADTFHMNIEEADMAATLRSPAGRLGYMHLADSNRRAPGMGHTDFGPMLTALRDVVYGGYVSAEVLPIPDDIAAAERFVAFCRRNL